MAEENSPGTEEQESPGVPAEQAGGASADQPSRAETPEEEAGTQPSWSAALLGLALLAVLLTLVGVYGQVQKRPNHLPMGLGLLLWGLLDLAAQRRGLVRWRGAKAVAGNTVNLLRGVALLGVGAWMVLMAVGALPDAGTATVTTVGVSLLAAYLGTALVLEILVKGVRLSGHAFLLASLAFVLASYLYFAIPFTYAWAAVFALLAFCAAVWSIYAGVMEETPALSRAVLLAVLLLSAPFGTYTFQQMFLVEEQPLENTTLLIPRMRQVVKDLGEDAAQITWAPVHTQPGQPGDIPYSDKLAFTDWRDHKPGVGLFVQQDDGKGQLSWLDTGEDAALTGFSRDGRVLALTQVREGAKAPSLAVLEPVDPRELAAARQAAQAAAMAEAPEGEDAKAKHARLRREKEALVADLSPYRLKVLYAASVEPGPGHNQVWRGLSRQLYFAGPQGGLAEGASAVYRADLGSRQVSRLRSGRGLPAVSPDGSALLSVGFKPSERYLEIADGPEGGRDPRRFQHRREARYFPAWNLAQTRVLFLRPRDGALMIMNSNGTNQREFDPEDLDSKVWRSERGMDFTLQWRETGDTYQVWRSKPDGSGERLLYEVQARAISAPTWSPDGARVALIVRDASGSSILTVGADGAWPRRFFTTPDALAELQWSPNSQRLAWICARGNGTQEVWTASAQGLDPVRVHASPGRLSNLDWSPRNGHLAVQETAEWRLLGLRLVRPEIHNVLMIDLAQGKARVMTRYGIMARGPAFSPQGVALGYFSDQRPWHPGLLRERSSALVISQLF